MKLDRSDLEFRHQTEHADGGDSTFFMLIRPDGD